MIAPSLCSQRTAASESVRSRGIAWVRLKALRETQSLTHKSKQGHPKTFLLSMMAAWVHTPKGLLLGDIWPKRGCVRQMCLLLRNSAKSSKQLRKNKKENRSARIGFGVRRERLPRWTQEQ